jgi:hypothetical protein
MLLRPHSPARWSRFPTAEVPSRISRRNPRLPLPLPPHPVCQVGPPSRFPHYSVGQSRRCAHHPSSPAHRASPFVTEHRCASASADPSSLSLPRPPPPLSPPLSLSHTHTHTRARTVSVSSSCSPRRSKNPPSPTRALGF